MLQSIITNLPYFLLLLLGFGFIIFVHELGHFLVAKAVGIKCTQFAVGMGPAIVAWRKGLGYRLGSTEPAYEKALAEGADVKSMGETEYRLCWLPIGGYVKMLGQEDMDATAGSKAAADPRSYTAKPIWARMCVISAGVVMNIIFGLVFFAIAFSLGVKFNAPVVGPVAPGSKAATTYAQGHEDDPAYQGLRAGDTILTLDGQPIADLQELRINVALSEPGHPMTLVVDRDGQPLTYVIEPEAIPGYMQGLLTIGFDTPITLELTANLPPDRLPTALVEAGVRGGMRVTAVDGKPVAHYGQFREALLAARGREVPVTFRDEAGNAVQVALAANPQPQINLNGDRMTPHVLGLESAVHIESVIGGSAAEAAGIQPGDILARLGRYDLPSVEQVLATVADAGSSPLELAVIREGRRVDLPAVAPRRKKLGIAFGLTPTTSARESPTKQVI